MNTTNPAVYMHSLYSYVCDTCILLCFTKIFLTTPIHLEENGVLLTNDNLVTTLNHFFLSVNEDVPTLDLSKLPAYLPAADQLPIIHPYQVCKKLLCLNSSKAAGPDNIPPRILKDFAYELSDPLAEIFNLSIASATSPSQWKSANISSIPKVTPPKEKDDLRPISLTSCISQVLEEFVVEWILEDIGHLIDPKQFGCPFGSSTTLCLLDMFHSWLSKLDTDGCSLRIVLLDFSQAFDRINLNVLITKLIDMGLRRSLIPWLCDFLSNRRQRVKLGESISEWAQVNAGVAQGTKLGPILFLVMVNDLKTLQSDRWKYVDDLTISDVIPKHSQSNMQHELDYISNWCDRNYMKLNPKKCKELRVNFQRALPDLAQLTIDGTSLETINSHKLLGLHIQNDLKWNEHVDIITKKAAKRLYIIRTLKSSGVPDDDLISIYTSLIRSILDYGCAVWHTCLPSFLVEKIGRIQKRFFRVIFPHLSYREALAFTGYQRLEDNRQSLCLKLFNKLKTQPSLKLSHLVPCARYESHGRLLRGGINLSSYKCRTGRYRNSFFPTMTEVYNQYYLSSSKF